MRVRPGKSAACARILWNGIWRTERLAPDELSARLNGRKCHVYFEPANEVAAVEADDGLWIRSTSSLLAVRVDDFDGDGKTEFTYYRPATGRSRHVPAAAAAT